MEIFDIKGIWKGEYVYDDRFQPAAIKTSFPFILRIKSVGPDGLFEGICQDDPVITQIDFHADVCFCLSRPVKVVLTCEKRGLKT